MKLLIHVPPSYPTERQYICDVLLGEFLGLDFQIEIEERSDVLITAVNDPDRKQLILADVLFTHDENQWLTKTCMPARPFTMVRPHQWARELSADWVLPVLYGRPDENHHPITDPKTIQLDLDLMGSCFFLLTRYEEVVRPMRDGHGRYPATSSLLYKENLLDRPLVNEYIELLFWALQRLWPDLQRAERHYRVLLSHDVDLVSAKTTNTCWTTLLSCGADVVLRTEPTTAVRRMTSWAATRRNPDRDIFNTFDWMMDQSEQRGLHSAFYFQTEGGTETYSADYQIEDDWIRQLLKRIHKRGFEIGLHPGYDSHKDPQEVARQFDRFKRVCLQERIHQDQWGGRQHFLQWENPVTWRNWNDAGLHYDSTLTFADAIGFRCGVCYEYSVFDLKARRPLNLIERPLLAMEVTLSKYMQYGWDAAGRKLERLADYCRMYGGDFTLLWHNSNLVTQIDRDGYVQILDLIA